MAHAGFLEKDWYNCTICKDELKDPVTVPCGHSYCKACINGYWDLGVYVCPQCRQSFTPRPVLGTNAMLINAIRAAFAKRAEAAPAPKPSVVVKDEDDDEDDEEGEET